MKLRIVNLPVVSAAVVAVVFGILMFRPADAATTTAPSPGHAASTATADVQDHPPAVETVAVSRQEEFSDGCSIDTSASSSASDPANVTVAAVFSCAADLGTSVADSCRVSGSAGDPVTDRMSGDGYVATDVKLAPGQYVLVCERLVADAPAAARSALIFTVRSTG